MKKTLIFAIVLAFIMAIAAPAFAEAGELAFEVVMAKESGTFKYTAKGESKAADVELTDAIVAEVKVNGEPTDGTVTVKFDEKLTYAGFNWKSFAFADAMCQVNEPTLETGTEGQIKFAFAGTETITAGTILKVAFTAELQPGEEVKVEVIDADMHNEEGETYTNKLGEGVYKEEAAPVESQEPTPVESQEPTPVESQEPTPVESQEPTPVESQKPVGPDTGAPSLVAVAVISIVAGLGAIALRKED